MTGQQVFDDALDFSEEEKAPVKAPTTPTTPSSSKPKGLDLNASSDGEEEPKKATAMEESDDDFESDSLGTSVTQSRKQTPTKTVIHQKRKETPLKVPLDRPSSARTRAKLMPRLHSSSTMTKKSQRSKRKKSQRSRTKCSFTQATMTNRTAALADLRGRTFPLNLWMKSQDP